MIRYIYGRQLNLFPKLKETMLRDRAAQFRDRLKWEVSVDADGFERDQYDKPNTLYVIWQEECGRHGGSMRFLPSTGATMVNEHFSDLLPDGKIAQDTIWETTRFCLSPEAERGSKVPALLMLAGAQLGVSFGLSHSIGVFDARMVRIYRKLGWEPEILGTCGEGREAISAGLWEFGADIRDGLAEKAGVSPVLAQMWFRQSFGPTEIAEAA